MNWINQSHAFVQQNKKAIFKMLWVYCLCSIVFLFFVSIPHKGFDFTDSGFYLYNSYILSHGIAPGYGFGSIVNSIFMIFNIHSYLFYEILYFSLIIAATVFFWQRVYPVINSPILPLTIIVAFTLHRTYFISYQHSPGLFLILAISFLLLSEKIKGQLVKSLVLITSSLFFILAAVSNISLLPTIFSTFLIIWLFYKVQHKKMEKLFYFSYIIFTIIFLIFYIFSPLSLFHSSNLTAYQNTTLIGPLSKIPALLAYIFTKKYLLITILCVIVRLACCKIFKKYSCFILPATYILSFILILYPMINLFRFKPADSIIMNGQALLFKSLIIALIIFFKKEKRVLYTSLLGIISITFGCGLALTTRSGFYNHIGLLAVANIICISLLFEMSTKEIKPVNSIYRICFYSAMLILCFITTFAFVKYNYRGYPTFSKKNKIQHGIFRGIYANETKISTIKQINNLYKKYECKSKIFFAYPAQPLLYYLFQKRAPHDQSWISASAPFLSNLQIIHFLKTKQHWCAIVTPKFNYNPAAYTHPVQSYLRKNSDHIKIITLPKPSEHSLYPWKIYFYTK